MSTESPPSYQVFLSYSSKDRKWAEAACHALEQRRVRCWIAPRDITPGTEWGAAIIRGIDQCKVLVLIFSSHANASAQVRREVERAIAKGLVVLPFRIEDVLPQGSMEYALSNTHWLDAFAPPVERRFRQLADSVHALLSAKLAAPPEDDEAAEADDPAPTPTPATDPPRPVSPLRRAVQAALALAGIAAVFALAASFLPRGNRDPATPSAPAGLPAPGDGIEETPMFQGPWVADFEQYPRGRTKNAEQLARTPVRWVIRGETLNTLRTSEGKIVSSIQGKASFRARGGNRSFDFEGTDDRGNTVKWVGIYTYEENYLQVCFRIKQSPTDTEAERPTAFPHPNEAGSFYIKLRRPRGPNRG